MAYRLFFRVWLSVFVSFNVCKPTHDTGIIPSVRERFIGGNLTLCDTYRNIRNIVLQSILIVSCLLSENPALLLVRNMSAQ